MAVQKAFRVLDSFEVSGTANVASTLYVGGVLTAAANVTISANLSAIGISANNIDTKTLAVSNGSYTFNMVSNPGVGAFNALTELGDALLYSSNGTINQVSIVIGPWSNRASGLGIRINPIDNSIKVAANTITFGTTGISANGSIGTNGQVLFSNGTSAFWNTLTTGVTSVATGNGISGGTITGSGTLQLVSGNGISVTAGGVNILVATSGLTANSTGLHVVNPILRMVTTGYTTGGQVYVSATTPGGTPANGDIWIQI